MPIPNNIGLELNQPLTRQLNSYQHKFRAWWSRCGPAEFLDRPMNLRCPTGVTEGGSWSEVRRIAPSDYEWGLFQVPTKDSAIEFGSHKGTKLWSSPPDEVYPILLALIVTQADAEYGSVEQCRELTHSAPSVHDLENLFQFYLEESRHSWAMVHLLLEGFGEDGVVESEELLYRMCGETYRPRLLNSFNYRTDDWLAHFLWCFLADRNARYQVGALSRSAFKPLRETGNFMLFEEPMHIQFGIQGLERTIMQSARITMQRDHLDIFEDGAIPLPVIQRYMNFWFPAVYDLFGNDYSADASNMYQCGIRAPRNFEAMNWPSVVIDTWTGDRIQQVEVKPELAINAIMRRQFIQEIKHTVDYWNRCLARLNIDYQLQAPHERFNRKVGALKDVLVDPNGNLLKQGGASQDEPFLPTAKDLEQVRALMVRVLDPDGCASWIAPPCSRLKNLVQEIDEQGESRS